jgi:threonine/homoserine/homoserine lactone efflux protein
VEIAFQVLAILQIAAGVYLLWQGIQWLTYVQKRLKMDPGFYAPRTAVLCPCRGMEPGL